MADLPTVAEWEAAFAALATLVRDEYPEGYSLAEIAERWGSSLEISPEQIAALRSLESLAPEVLDRVVQETSKGANVESAEVGD